MWLVTLVFLFVVFGIATVGWMSVSKHGLSNDLSLGTAIGSGLTLFGLPLCGVMLLRATIRDTIKLFRTQEK
jgi:TRAP-type C4-dicarboxylate transport system permease small subunit